MGRYSVISWPAPDGDALTPSTTPDDDDDDDDDAANDAEGDMAVAEDEDDVAGTFSGNVLICGSGCGSV